MSFSGIDVDTIILSLPALTTVLGSCPGTSSLIISLPYVRRTDAVTPSLLLVVLLE